MTMVAREINQNAKVYAVNKGFVYSVLKRCYGNHLSSRKRTAQRRELHLKTLSYNIEIANLTTIRQENR